MALIKTMDTSNYQPRDLSALIWKHEPQHVIPRLFLPEERPGQDISVAQLHSAINNGCSTAGYFWLYNGLDPVKSVQDAINLYHLAAVGKLPILWFDIEPYNYEVPTVDAIRLGVNYCIAQGVRPGIYTGKWVSDAYYRRNQLAEFAHLPWLLAYYDHNPDLDHIDLGFGYTIGGQQYTDYPVDLSTIFEQYTKLEDNMTDAEKEIIRNIVGPLRTWATSHMKKADAVEQIGAGEDWQFKDSLERREQIELTDFADRLDSLIS